MLTTANMQTLLQLSQQSATVSARPIKGRAGPDIPDCSRLTKILFTFSTAGQHHANNAPRLPDFTPVYSNQGCLALLLVLHVPG